MSDSIEIRALVLRVFDRYAKRYPNFSKNYSLIQLLAIREAGYDIDLDVIDKAAFDEAFPKLSSLDRAIRVVRKAWATGQIERLRKEIEAGRQRTLDTGEEVR